MRLRDDLDHLPDLQRRELELAVRILFETFAEALGDRVTQEHKRNAAILKVILFGSFARGDWVEDRASGYMSDYDLLVVVSDDRLTDQTSYWDGAADRFVRELTVTHALRRPVNFIVHSLQDLNAQLERGRPFFLDIVRDGIALYEASGYPLESQRILPAEEARREAQEYFDEWFPSAGRRFELAMEANRRAFVKEAAFDLHQAAERLYHCILLVLTLYGPKSHKLDVLRSLAEDLDPRLRAAWPREDRASRRGFDRIRRAYVEARYSPHYTITPEELAFAFEHVTAVLGRSDFSFAELKERTSTVFLVLPPDRLDAYARWLRLMVVQAMTALARSPAKPPSPVLFLLDEFAALGRLEPVERASGSWPATACSSGPFSRTCTS